jgi:hypothetical protein
MTGPFALAFAGSDRLENSFERLDAGRLAMLKVSAPRTKENLHGSSTTGTDNS